MITSPSGRIYVGSCINFDRRFKEYKRYKCKSQSKLYNSLKKYGWENHVFEIVMKTSLEEMWKYETLIGWGFNTLEKETGLNLQLPKLGDVYSCVSQEVKDKMSKLMKGHHRGLGKILSDETKEKIRKGSLGNKNWLGKHHSQETKDKLSNLFKGQKQSQTQIEKRSKSRMKPILQYSIEGHFIKEWESAKTAGKQLNINNNGITACCKNQCKTSKGYKWKYKF